MADGVAAHLVVHQAETGLTFLLAPEACTSVEAVKYALAPASGVALEHQILLYDGEKLDDARALADYGLPHEGNAVFLFDRALLARDASPPPPTVLSPAELTIPPAPELPPVQLRKGSSPLVHALLDYRTQFYQHLSVARAYRDAADARVHSLMRCASEQAVQLLALNAALANLHAFASQLAERYARFRERLGEQMRAKQALVDAFDDDLGRLRAIELHPALLAIEGFERGAEGAPLTLLDCCGEGRLRTWLAECEQHADTLVARAAELATSYGELAHAVDSQHKRSLAPARGALAPADEAAAAGGALEAAGGSGAGAAAVPSVGDERLRRARARLDEQEAAVRALESDYARVCALVDEHRAPAEPTPGAAGLPSVGKGGGAADGAAEPAAASEPPPAERAAAGAGCGGGGGSHHASVEAASELSLLRRSSSSGVSANARLSYECAALEELRTEHTDATLARLGGADDELRALQRQLGADKSARTAELHGRLRAVSTLQAAISELRSRLSVYSTLLARVHNYCVHLRFLHGLPRTYAACLAQISCRRAYGLAFEARAHAAVESLAALRDDEFSARMAFMQDFGRMLPRGLPTLARLLQSPPPHCEVRMPAPEVPWHLPQITPAQLAHVLAATSDPDAEAAAAALVAAQGDEAPATAAAAAHAGADARLRAAETENARLRAELAYRAVRAAPGASDAAAAAAADADADADAVAGAQPSSPRSPVPATASTAAAETSPHAAAADADASTALALSQAYAALLEARGREREAQVAAYEARIEQLEQALALAATPALARADSLRPRADASASAASATSSTCSAAAGSAAAGGEAGSADEGAPPPFALLAASAASSLRLVLSASAASDAPPAADERPAAEADADADAAAFAAPLAVAPASDAQAEAAAGAQAGAQAAAELAALAPVAPSVSAGSLSSSALIASPVLALRGALPSGSLASSCPQPQPAQPSAPPPSAAHEASAHALNVLRKGIAEARRCLPPRAAADAAGGAAAPAAEPDADVVAVEGLLASARQAARANMTLGRALQSTRALAQARLSYAQLEPNCRALFLLAHHTPATPGEPAPGRHYVAFGKGLPNRFLKPSCVPALAAAAAAEGAAADAAAADAPPQLVGEVRLVEGPLVASAELGQREFALAAGSEFWLLTAEPVAVPAPASPALQPQPPHAPQPQPQPQPR